MTKATGCCDAMNYLREIQAAASRVDDRIQRILVAINEVPEAADELLLLEILVSLESAETDLEEASEHIEYLGIDL